MFPYRYDTTLRNAVINHKQSLYTCNMMTELSFTMKYENMSEVLQEVEEGDNVEVKNGWL